jgi:hypothetical protein
MPDAAQRIRDALAGKYDAPIRLDPAANRADTRASGGHADALQPDILLRLQTGDERVSTAEEEHILRKAQQIVARRLAVRAEEKAREAERRQLEALQAELAPLAMQQDEPTAQAPATDPRTVLPPTHSLYIPRPNPDINPVAMNPQRAQDAAAAHKWYSLSLSLSHTHTHTHKHTHTNTPHTQERGRPLGGAADTSHSTSGSRRRGCSYFGRTQCDASCRGHPGEAKCVQMGAGEKGGAYPLSVWCPDLWATAGVCVCVCVCARA